MKVDRIDHVHVEVKDRDEAAEWYERILGLTRDASLAMWADDPMGPLVLATPDGTPVLTLFARPYQQPTRDSTVAFRVSSAEFLGFLAQVETLNLTHFRGHTLTRQDLIDHQVSWSIYFVDPYDNRIEVTTYDYAQVAAEL